MHAKGQSCLTLSVLWSVACQVPLSMGFSRQEYWSGLPFPCLGNLLDPGTEFTSPSLAGRFFNTESPGKLYFCYLSLIGSFSHVQVLETLFRHFCYHENPTTCLKKISVEKHRILLAIRIANIESYFRHQPMLLLKISFLTEISTSYFFLFELVSVL